MVRQMSEFTQKIIVGVIVAVALIYFIRHRIKSAKAKSGSCPNCTIEH